MKDKDFVHIAVEEAEKCKIWKFGAVIVKEGVVIARGHNETVERNDATAHAEIVTLQNAFKATGTRSLVGCTLYTNVEPCFMCFTAAAWADISRVVYPKTRHECPKEWYLTDEFDVRDLNKYFNKKLQIDIVDV